MTTSTPTTRSLFRRGAAATIAIGMTVLALTACGSSTQVQSGSAGSASAPTSPSARGTAGDATPVGGHAAVPSASESAPTAGVLNAAVPAEPSTAGNASGINNSTDATNHPDGTSLGHDQSDYEWYYCDRYNKIESPLGTVSAYPYLGNNIGWKNVSDSGWVSATLNNAERYPDGMVQFLYTNWSLVSRHTAQVTFDCSSLYPTEGITGMRVTSVDASDTGTATITWQLDTTVLGADNILPTSTWHVEYGSAPGDYRSVSPALPYDSQGPHGDDPRSITLTGLTPGTTYHFRVVLDVKSYFRNGNVHSSFTDPNNSFTTATSAAYVIGKSGAPTDQLLEANGSSDPVAGGPVDTWHRTPDGDKTGPNQVWTFTPSAAGVGLLKNNWSGLCLEINGTDGTIDQWDCDPTENHQWEIVRRIAGGYALKITLTSDLVQWKAGSYYLATQDASDGVADGSALTLLTDSTDARAAWEITGAK